MALVAIDVLLPRLLFTPVVIVLLSKFFSWPLIGYRSPGLACLTDIATVLTMLEGVLVVLPMRVFGTKSTFSLVPSIYISIIII